MTTPAMFNAPDVAPCVDGGHAYTTTPGIPYFMIDGSTASDPSSNPSYDGGNAFYSPADASNDGCA